MDTSAFVIVAVGMIVFALTSKRLASTILTGPMVFAGLGLAIGSAGLGTAEFHFGPGFIRLLAEVTLILVLFSDAARMDLRLVRRDHGLPLRMLLIGMPLTVAVGTAVAFGLPLGLGLWEAALLAAVLAPTDAALGQSVVASQRVPARIRQALNVETGLNDGIALPLVLLFASLASAGNADAGDRDWIAFGAMQVTLGPLTGIVIGGIAARLIDRAVTADWMARSYEGPAILAVALVTYACAELIGGNGFIAVFAAGLVFGNQVRHRCQFLFEFAEAEGQLLTLLTFMVFGAAILPQAFGHVGWTVLAYAVLSLTLIRMLPVAASLTGAGLTPTTVGFLGWFGPRGLGSVLFALFVLEDAAIPGSDTILAAVIVTVALSILAHGLTAAPGARWYGNLDMHRRDVPEALPVAEMPTRTGMASMVAGSAGD